MIENLLAFQWENVLVLDRKTTAGKCCSCAEALPPLPSQWPEKRCRTCICRDKNSAVFAIKPLTAHIMRESLLNNFQDSQSSFQSMKFHLLKHYLYEKWHLPVLYENRINFICTGVCNGPDGGCYSRGSPFLILKSSSFP